MLLLINSSVGIMAYLYQGIYCRGSKSMEELCLVFKSLQLFYFLYPEKVIWLDLYTNLNPTEDQMYYPDQLSGPHNSKTSFIQNLLTLNTIQFEVPDIPQL